MGSRKLIRDLFLYKKPLIHNFLTPQQSNVRLRLIGGNCYSSNRQFSVFNDFSKKIKDEASSNKEFQRSVKQLKDKAEELKGVKEDLKVKVKQSSEQLHKHVDGVWTEAEQTAKKVSANMKEKISAAKEEVKETLGLGNQKSSSANSTENGRSTKASSGEQHKKTESSSTVETLFSKFRSTLDSSSPMLSSALQKVKDAKVADLAKTSYEIVKDELSGKPPKRKRMQHTASPGETSDRTEIVVVPGKQSPWSNKWEAVKEKVQSHPMFKRIYKISEPVVTKSQELKEDLQERWDTSDSPVVHKIQDINDKVFGENDAALSFKEIRRRDPSFSLTEFVSEVQEVVEPVLNAYRKGDFKLLNKYCSTQIVERCKAEHKVFQSQGIFFDNKILHVSEVDVRETKMLENKPLIILGFQTQQVYCAHDRHGSITEGSKDTIKYVYYAWAMQQLDPEDIKDDDAVYSMWRLYDMQQLGMAALI